MNLNGWEHYDLEVEMSKSNMAQLLELYKSKELELKSESVNLLKMFNGLNEEGRAELEKQCITLLEAKCKIALKIADILTDIKGDY